MTKAENKEFFKSQAALIRERLARYCRMVREPEIMSDNFRNSYMANKFSFSVPNGRIALGKIKKGTYEICDNCEGPINRERLLAVPAALLCIKCQEKFEKK
jgi:RNA polymerase-binding transcription factor DksA